MKESLSSKDCESLDLLLLQRVVLAEPLSIFIADVGFIFLIRVVRIKQGSGIEGNIVHQSRLKGWLLLLLFKF